MKRMNTFFTGEKVPASGQWVSFIRPVMPDEIGKDIPEGLAVLTPTRYKRPNRKRGWMARVMAQAKRKRGWLDRIRGTFPDMPTTVSEM